MLVQVDELSRHLEVESTRSTQLESTNCELREQLASMKIFHKNHEKLEKSKLQLEEEVANLKRQVQNNLIDLSQVEQYKREIEERAKQEIRQKLEEVNFFLQVTYLFPIFIIFITNSRKRTYCMCYSFFLLFFPQSQIYEVGWAERESLAQNHPAGFYISKTEL